MANSATAEALRPGVLHTRMLRARAAAMSMFTGPPRETATSRRRGSRSIMPAESGASCVTSTSAASTKPTMVSGSPWYSFKPSMPARA